MIKLFEKNKERIEAENEKKKEFKRFSQLFVSLIPEGYKGKVNEDYRGYIENKDGYHYVLAEGFFSNITSKDELKKAIERICKLIDARWEE